MPKIIIRQTELPDATVNVNGNLLTTVPAGATENVEVLQSSGIVAVGTIDTGVVRVADSDITLNGGAFLSVKAEDTQDIELLDQTDTPIIPLSVVGNVVKVDIPVASNLTWTRNPDWIALPTIISSDNRFVGLFIVYENGYNFVTMTLSGTTLDVDVDWGDTTSVNVTGIGTTISKTYDYTALGGTIKVDPYTNRNYKQVIIDLIVNSGTFTAFQLIPATTINNGGNVQFVDISMSLPNTLTLNLSSPNKRLMILERLAIYNNNVTNPNSFTTSTQMPNLGEFIFEPILLTSLASEFPLVGCINGLDIIANSATSIANAWNGNYNVRRINNISSTTINTAFQMCLGARQLWYFGNLTLPLCTTLQTAWGSCDRLIHIGLIDTPIVTTIGGCFNACYSLQSVEFTDLSLCTITTGVFNLCVSLEFAILPNLTVGFSVAGTKMGTQALNDMFTSLGIASGSQTIIVTNTPGASTCDTTIATAKGYTVTI